MFNQLFFRSDALLVSSQPRSLMNTANAQRPRVTSGPVAIRSLARFVALHSPEHIEWNPTLKTLVALSFSYEGPPDDL